MLDRREFLWTFVTSATGAGLVLESWPAEASGVRRGSSREGPGISGGRRVGCLFNGYLLTVNPHLALAASLEDRHRLYTLHAVLIDPGTGRIAATYPSLPGDPDAEEPWARPAADYQVLREQTPAAPGITIEQLIAYWRRQGVDEALLTNIWYIDLEGSVVTPGLHDGHFHVSSFSKKLPPPNRLFGYYADVADPRYFIDPDSLERVPVGQAMSAIVRDANSHLEATQGEKIFLHGYWFTTVDDLDGQAGSLFRLASGRAIINDQYLLNTVGRGQGASFHAAPAMLIHTSGQACWYNSAVFEEFNRIQIDNSSQRFAEVSVLSVSRDGDDVWLAQLDPQSPNLGQFYALGSGMAIDLVIQPGAGGPEVYVPLYVVDVNQATHVLSLKPLLPEIAEAELGASSSAYSVRPFYRKIVDIITAEHWAAAEEYSQTPADEHGLAYGQWDPRNPHKTNWYNGSERGLIQYVFDHVDEVWRPSGYAEHYVMRDALSAAALDPLTVDEGITQRRSLARWCHRHGITSVQDIMFYRRNFAAAEFFAYEGLSFDHRFRDGWSYYDRSGLDHAIKTGGFNLRIGLYYYIENAGGVTESLNLALADLGDQNRLAPPFGHPEGAGWVRWLGWKLQLDGGIGARTIFSNAPTTKVSITDPFETVAEDGSRVTFRDHSFGLLTMTNVQEQVFSSRETAALYWLVRESDPSSAFYNSSLTGDWSFLSRGVRQWIGIDIDTELLRSDVALLGRVEFESDDHVADFAKKIETLFEQVHDGWERTLKALARIWYEKSMNDSVASQVVCHNAGDGAVDLYIRALAQLKADIADFPSTYAELPDYWQAVVPEDADLALIAREFRAERYRIEHLINISYQAIDEIVGAGGIDEGLDINERNIVCSTQPALLVLDGESIRLYGFPYAQELWNIPDANRQDLWLGVPASPRYHHELPCPVYVENDIPFGLNTDPPAVRDPRPALTIVGAVARTPLEINPGRWLDQYASEPPERPFDYLAGTVFAPLGLTPASPENPMALTVEQCLSVMTFWSAYIANSELELGAIAAPGTTRDGWMADLVVWAFNPLAIMSPSGLTLEDLATIPAGQNDEQRLEIVNSFIEKFRPSMTLVGGVPVYN